MEIMAALAACAAAASVFSTLAQILAARQKGSAPYENVPSRNAHVGKNLVIKVGGDDIISIRNFQASEEEMKKVERLLSEAVG